MGRIFVPLLLLILLSCGTGRDWQAEYDSVVSLYQRGDLGSAYEAASELATEATGTEDVRFRLLGERIRISQRRAEDALVELDALATETRGDVKLEGVRQLYRAVALFYQGQLDACAGALDAAAAGLGSEPAAELAELGLWRANLALRKGEDRAAEAGFVEALATAQAIENKYFRAAAWGGLGRLRADAGLYDEASRYYRLSLADTEAIGAENMSGLTHGNLGVYYSRLGQIDRAQHELERAVEIHERTGNLRDLTRWQVNLGNTHENRGDYGAAREAYVEALGNARELQSAGSILALLNNLAFVSIRLGDMAAAEEYVGELERELAESGDSTSSRYWNALINRGLIDESEGRLAAATRLFRDAQVGDDGDPETGIRAAGHLIRVLGAEGRRTEARRVFSAAEKRLESFRSSLADLENRFSYFDSLTRLYDAYIQLLVDEGRAEEAFLVAESARGRVFSRRTDGESDANGANLIAELRAESVRSGRVFLSFWTAPQRSFGWLITSNGIGLEELPGRAQIATEVARFRLAVEQDRLDPVREQHPSVRFLTDQLLTPLVGDLADGTAVTIVPDGPLHSLNFEMLPASEGRRYWLETANISIAPSLRAVLRVDRTAPEGQPLLVGNPVATDEEFPALPYTADELAGIARTLGLADDLPLTREDATPGAVLARAAGAPLIHFAAHAQANRVSPLESAVILSPESGKYKLYARDWLDVELSAELVTISSCNSAGARSYDGEGLVGFAWVFLQAGAKNVVAGLWPVNDAATAELMAAFYERLAAGAKPADALRGAKLAMLRKPGSRMRLPYYWAPFQVYTTRL